MVLRIGSLSFDPVSLSLTRDGEFVRASRKSMELLALLTRDAGRVIPAAALREKLWPEGFVEDRNLSQQIYVLRHVLAGEDGVRIETIPRRGYRLVLPSTTADAVRSPRVLRFATRWALGGSIRRAEP